VTFGDRGQPLEDGNPRWDDDGAAVFEAKFILPWPFSEERAAEKHMEQLQASLCWPSARTFMLPPARMTAASMLVSQIPTAPRNTILE